MSEDKAETHRDVYRTSLSNSRDVYRKGVTVPPERGSIRDGFTLDRDGNAVPVYRIDIHRESNPFSLCDTCDGTGRIPDSRVTPTDRGDIEDVSVMLCTECRGKGTAYDESLFRGNV